VLTPFAVGVLAGIFYLLIRRALIRPPGLGDNVSIESIAIGLLIATLMVTFLLGWRLDESSLAGRANWWVHMSVILVFLALIPASKHFHLVLSPITVFLKSPELGRVPNLDFEKEQVGLDVVNDLGSKTVLDAFTCVECGRCQVNCPAWGAGKELNPKTLILQTQHALLAGARDTRLGGIYTEKVLWQCTSCGACENQCPVGIEHLPLIIGARRGLVSNGDAPEYLGGVYNHLERRGNIWGLSYDQRERFVVSAGLATFDPTKHDVLVWLGCAGASRPISEALRSLFEILTARKVRYGVLAKERCTGDPAKRTGNEYIFQELARANIADLKSASPKKILTSCPHCVKTIGDDYRRMGYEVDIVHSAVFVEEITRDLRGNGAARESVTFHDPCYLGRYGGHVDEPRELLTRFGAEISEPVRNRENPYCCGAGGGLLFADKEEEPGSRISDVRFQQLRETGAGTVVTACPFCSIMLKGAQTSVPGAELRFVDLMTYVNGQLTKP
jgi:Fe-S oxidoreductase